MNWSKFFILFLFVSLIISAFFNFYVNNKFESVAAKAKTIIVDKGRQTLELYSYSGKKIKSFPVSSGLNPGNKLIKGDLKTPEGIFPIIQIQNSSSWEYDFEDDTLGPIIGAYGPFFLRLQVSSREIFKNTSKVPKFTVDSSFKGIGIHGTHDSLSVGKRCSHGCIRLKNTDLLELIEHIYIGLNVIIIGGNIDQEINSQ